MEKIKYSKERLKEDLLMLAVILLGNMILALGVMVFISPMNFMVGGATGIGMMLERTLGIKLSLCVGALNVVMFVIGLLVLGKRFATTTLLSTFIYPSALAVLESIPAISTMNTDPVIAAVFGGAMIGLGVGMVIRVGASTGGMDIPPIILQKKTGIPVAISMNLMDIVIILIQVPGSNIQYLFYSILEILATMVVMDKIAMFGVTQTQVMIMSNKYEEINDAIQQKLDRGTTLLESVSGHLKNPQKVVMSIINNRQFHEMTNVVKEIDPNAFMVVNRVNEVHGNGFTVKLDDKQRIEALKNK